MWCKGGSKKEWQPSFLNQALIYTCLVMLVEVIQGMLLCCTLSAESWNTLFYPSEPLCLLKPPSSAEIRNPTKLAHKVNKFRDLTLNLFQSSGYTRPNIKFYVHITLTSYNQFRYITLNASKLSAFQIIYQFQVVLSTHLGISLSCNGYLC